MLFRVRTGPILYCTVAAIACFFRPVAVNIYTPSDGALVILAAYVLSRKFKLPWYYHRQYHVNTEFEY